MVYLQFIIRFLTLSGLLYGYYYFFLRNRGFHRYNRWYLLAASVVTIVVPFLRISVHVLVADGAAAPLGGTLRVITGGLWEESGHVKVRGDIAHGWVSVASGVWMLYFSGILAGLIAFVRALLYIVKVRRKYGFEYIDRGRLYHTTEVAAPFSFFRSIFWHQRIPLESKDGEQIFRHELFHVMERHSVDVVWMELYCMLFWFNPFCHLMKQELTAIHEFLADEYAVSANDPLDYAELLVVLSIGQREAGLTSPMFRQTIKRRIIMITQFNKKTYGYLSRWMILPIAAGVICLMAFRVMPLKGRGLPHPVQPITVMIDAGHGGIDPGASGGKGGADEKVLTLELAQRIKALSGEYHMNVILTRDEDILPGHAADKQQGLENRVAMAKAAGATAFISIHVNNTGDDKTTERSGFEAYVSSHRVYKGSEELASAVLKRIQPFYATLPDVLKRDEGIYVLDKTDCSAILLECGYINNAKDVQFVTNKDNQDKIARSILQGIVDFQAGK